MNPLNENPPLQQIFDDLFVEKGVEVFMKREDLIHPEISGNKWRKLKYNLYEARMNGQNTLLTFGGPYSNHIYATAAAASLFHFRAIGIIRGEEPVLMSDTLRFAQKKGMELYYMDRAMYREKDKPESIESLHAQIGDFYHIPEGGTNLLALEGVAEIIPQLDIDFDVLCTACGTGGTLAGLAAGLNGAKTLLGFSALKGDDLLTNNVNELTKSYNGNLYQNFSINFDYHFGGYAKLTDDLVQFIKAFHAKNNIQLEPVYTGKMMFGLYDLIRKDSFQRGTRIIALHTGGLQGLCGYNSSFPDWTV